MATSVQSPAQWQGFAEVAIVARRLNNLVNEALVESGLPIFPASPSASARCNDGMLEHMETGAIRSALDHGLIPVVYGDVAFDSVRGGTIISTETVFFYLAEALRPDRIFLLGEVEGVYDAAGAIIPRITPRNMDEIAGALGGSHGTDVTGGMLSKVRAMVALAERLPGLNIHIFGGLTPHQLEGALSGTPPGTHITSETT
jgi:isopentenyl phosphate kinase